MFRILCLNIRSPSCGQLLWTKQKQLLFMVSCLENNYRTSQRITYSFLVAGHAKFALDRCFGLIKKSYKVNYISSIYELATMVETSSSSGVNKAQLVGTHEGRIIFQFMTGHCFSDNILKNFQIS